MPEQRLQSYAVRLKGHLDASWVEECLLNHFAQIVVQHEPQGETRLACRHFDQAALNALCNRLYALNVELVSVTPLEAE